MVAITKKKLNQMQFAAKLYVQTKKITDTDLLLSVVSMTGDPPDVEEYVVLK